MPSLKKVLFEEASSAVPTQLSNCNYCLLNRERIIRYAMRRTVQMNWNDMCNGVGGGLDTN